MNIPLCHNNTIVLCFERVQYMTNIQYNNLGIEKRYYKMFALVPFKTGPGMNSFSLILLYYKKNIKTKILQRFKTNHNIMAMAKQ